MSTSAYCPQRMPLILVQAGEKGSVMSGEGFWRRQFRQGTEIVPYCYLAGLFPHTYGRGRERRGSEIWALNRKVFLPSSQLGTPLGMVLNEA